MWLAVGDAINVKVGEPVPLLRRAWGAANPCRWAWAEAFPLNV